MSYRTRWTILMTIGGLATAAVVWAITGNVWWTVVGLLVSGMVFNAIFNPGSRSTR
ncbi:MAG TPA: hypothetical protein VF148_05340 [Acidimicrobiia bacterium]